MADFNGSRPGDKEGRNGPFLISFIAEGIHVEQGTPVVDLDEKICHHRDCKAFIKSFLSVNLIE